MKAPLKSLKDNKIATYIERIRDDVLARWRAEARGDPEQAVEIHKLDDQELEDHLPALTDKIIAVLRGQAVANLEQDAAQHGRQRRAMGYSIVPLVRELQIFRRVLLNMVEEIVGGEAGAEEIERARKLIIDTIDRSMNVSILQYTLAAEEERDSAQDEARELHRQRDRFLATLSHELRNQISPILLGAQMLKDLQLGDQRVTATIDRIERQARHQAILINDLLDMSRFRYGKLQLKRENLDLRAPVAHALETLQSDFHAKRIKLAVELPERPLFASADQTRVAQILINLLNNSLKFTPPEGTVKVVLTERTGSAVLIVKDDGVGIDPEILPQIFTMFFQGKEALHGSKIGLGLGLAVAKILVDLHDGIIEAHSAGRGQGAEFIVRLPLVAHMPMASQPEARRVLVVDDNQDHRELLAQLLRGRDYEVIEAHDAHEALQLTSSQKPDACVIDIGLPDMDGYELARRLREIPATRDARLIAVTGYDTKANMEHFAQAGFEHYFHKPPNMEGLIRVLANNKSNMAQ